jgi:hypothetical protein
LSAKQSGSSALWRASQTALLLVWQSTVFRSVKRTALLWEQWVRPLVSKWAHQTEAWAHPLGSQSGPMVQQLALLARRWAVQPVTP